MSHEDVKLEAEIVSNRKIFIDDPDYEEGDEEKFGEMLPVSLDIAVHRCDGGNIIINFPGSRESVDGFNAKYRTLADYMQAKGLGAVVRSGNHKRKFHRHSTTLQHDIRSMIEYALENAPEICGTKDTTLYLMGLSAGTSAISLVAHDYEQVQKLLLMGPAPARNAEEYPIAKNLGKFTGDVFISHGQQDRVSDGRAGQMFYDWATSAARRELFIVRSCDHLFKGEVNGRIMSQLPFWAFADAPLPTATGGIKLYD